MKPLLRAAGCGLGWGLLVGYVFPPELEEPYPLVQRCLLGMALGIPIGVLIYLLSRWFYRRSTWLKILIWSAVSLYLAAALWGAGAFGIHRLLCGPASGAATTGIEMMMGAFVYCCGMTSLWPLLVLFLLLTLATHIWLMAQEPELP